MAKFEVAERRLFNIKICMRCVPEGTLVWGNDSLKPIESLSVDNRIQGLKGYQRILNTFRRKYSGKMVELNIGYLGKFMFTPDHEILVTTFKRNPETGKRCGGKPYWVRAGDLLPLKDGGAAPYVMVPKSSRTEEKIFLDMAPFLRKRGRTPIRKKLELSSTLAYVMGWYVAKGCADTSGVVFFLHPKEAADIEDLKKAARKLGYRLNCKPMRGKSCVRLLLPSRVLARAFKKWFGTGARKRLPSFLFSASPEVFRAFFEGYFRGGGCEVHLRERSYRMFSTSSPLLARQLQLLLMQKLGQMWGFSAEQHHRGDVICSGGARSNPRYTFRKDLRSERRGYLEDESFYYFPVETKEFSEFEGEVYNLETSENVYLLPFVVHNCNAHNALKATKCRKCGYPKLRPKAKERRA